MKKIYFNRAFDFAGNTGHPPTTSKMLIPDWFKKQSKYFGPNNNKLTIKNCAPFLDSMMSGYIISTEFDILVTKINGEQELTWKKPDFDLISLHHKDQISSEQIPLGFNPQPFKFNNPWQIKTTKGYSVLFSHPLNREDLPFRTLSGVVETDIYSSIINFPFFIKQDFEGVIPAGTPIVQITPIKRESWEMKIGEVDQKELFEADLRLGHKFFNSYKSQWWRRKEYR